MFLTILAMCAGTELIIIGLIGVCICVFLLFKKWKRANNLLETDIFKKYGSPEELIKIVQEIESTLLFEFNKLKISKNYI